MYLESEGLNKELTMKKSVTRVMLILAVVLLILVAAFVFLRVYRPGGLNNPESVVYDLNLNRFLVSSTGNGKIFSLDDKGDYKLLIKKGLDKPRGLAIFYPYLYIADNKEIKIADIDKGEVVGSIKVPGAQMLNDIAFDDKNLLFATDTGACKVFILDVSARKVVAELESELLNAPNGIVFDYPRRQMLIVGFKADDESFATNPILSLDTQTREFKEFMPSAPNTRRQLDGITIDKETGIIYFSSWADKAIYMIPQEQNRIEEFKSGLESPADLLFHNGELLVPLFNKNKIERVKAM